MKVFYSNVCFCSLNGKIAYTNTRPDCLNNYV